MNEPNSEIEKALEKYLNDYSFKVSHYYPLSILPVLLYIRSKTAEVTNIRTIVRAKEMELAVEEIEDLLVI